MSEPQHQLDTRAIEMASKALDRVETHEKYCSERYERINGSLSKIEGGIEQVHDRISKGRDAMSGKVYSLGLLIIGGLISAVVWLIVNGSPLQ